MFDILILVAPKDYNKLRFVCDSIIRNVEDYHKIYIVSPTAISDFDMYCDAEYLNDRDVLDFDFSKIKMQNRQGWYRQQFIKLFQEVTNSNWLVVDSDIWINKPLSINPGIPVFYLGKDQNHPAYFKLMESLFGFGRVYPHSFISELMLFKRGFVNYMLLSFGMDRKTFIEACVEKINEMNDASGFSEYELYGNYITKNFPNAYSHQYLNVSSNHKNRNWTDQEMSNLIKTNLNSDYDLLTMHSWI